MTCEVMRAVLFEGEPVCVKMTCYVIRAEFLKKAWLCEDVR